MTAIILLVGALLLLALMAGEHADFRNMKAGYPSAPTRWRFAAGLIVVAAGAALLAALWLISQVFNGGSPAP